VTEIIAHRGASHRERENTLAAFRMARSLGAGWVELDVRATADGALAVHHDPRLPDGRAVAAVAAAELPPGVPLLGAALDACGGMGVHVEIKNHPSEAGFDDSGRLAGAVAAAVAAWTGPVVVSSFDLATVDAVRRSGVATAWLVVAVDDTILTTTVDRHHALHPWHGTVDATLVERCHSVGLVVNVWTVDDPDRIVELAAWGVDGICTNEPDVAVAALRGRRV
jgi:glycerophosphoryl diester phosphodiesterase